MSHTAVCLRLRVCCRWLITVLMLGISSGYWLRHKPNPRGEDFPAPTATQLVYGDLFTYTRMLHACVWVWCVRKEKKRKEAKTQTCIMCLNWMTAALSACHRVPPLLLISNAACFVDLSSASGLWCGECLCCEPSAWSSRAPCSPCWSRRPSWKVRERLERHRRRQPAMNTCTS